MQWGWNPDSFAAIMTALAALAAVVAGGFAWFAYRAERDARELARQSHATTEKSYQAEREREQRDLEDRERAQAEMVSAWAVIGPGDEPTVEICIQNLSAAPVYSVRLGLFAKKSDCNYAGWVRVLPPTGSVTRQEPVHHTAAQAWKKYDGARAAKPMPMVEFTFHDAAGRWWLRDEHGVLTEIAENENWRYATKVA